MVVTCDTPPPPPQANCISSSQEHTRKMNSQPNTYSRFRDSRGGSSVQHCSYPSRCFLYRLKCKPGISTVPEPLLPRPTKWGLITSARWGKLAPKATLGWAKQSGRLEAREGVEPKLTEKEQNNPEPLRQLHSTLACAFQFNWFQIEIL